MSGRCSAFLPDEVEVVERNQTVVGVHEAVMAAPGSGDRVSVTAHFVGAERRGCSDKFFQLAAWIPLLHRSLGIGPTEILAAFSDCKTSERKIAEAQDRRPRTDGRILLYSASPASHDALAAVLPDIRALLTVYGLTTPRMWSPRGQMFVGMFGAAASALGLPIISIDLEVSDDINGRSDLNTFHKFAALAACADHVFEITGLRVTLPTFHTGSSQSAAFVSNLSCVAEGLDLLPGNAEKDAVTDALMARGISPLRICISRDPECTSINCQCCERCERHDLTRKADRG